MKAGRFPEAFVISFIKCISKDDGDLASMRTVVDDFMNTTHEPFINFLLQSMANNSWETVIEGSD